LAAAYTHTGWGYPDWCGEGDLNHEGKVNLIDVYHFGNQLLHTYISGPR